MRVKLAVQILSYTVSTALKHYVSEEASKTAMLCSMMNNMFISWQTYEGLKMDIVLSYRSRLLLKEGFKFILTE